MVTNCLQLVSLVYAFDVKYRAMCILITILQFMQQLSPEPSCLMYSTRHTYLPQDWTDSLKLF